jgi:hypothetical protein
LSVALLKDCFSLTLFSFVALNRFMVLCSSGKDDDDDDGKDKFGKGKSGSEKGNNSN